MASKLSTYDIIKGRIQIKILKSEKKNKKKVIHKNTLYCTEIPAHEDKL